MKRATAAEIRHAQRYLISATMPGTENIAFTARSERDIFRHLDRYTHSLRVYEKMCLLDKHTVERAARAAWSRIFDPRQKNLDKVVKRPFGPRGVPPPYQLIIEPISDN